MRLKVVCPHLRLDGFGERIEGEMGRKIMDLERYRKTLIFVIPFCLMFIYLSLADGQTAPGEPEKAIPIPKGEVAADDDRYIIGSEDVLFIYVWGEKELSRAATVRLDGKISMPLADEVQAAGVTPLQLKGKLTEKLKEYIENPTISVIVTEANSFKVFITGQVRTPGVYRLRAETSLAQIIAMAGGLTEWADQKKITILRREGGKEKRMVINFKKVISGDSPDTNIILKAGDTIIVP